MQKNVFGKAVVPVRRIFLLFALLLTLAALPVVSHAETTSPEEAVIEEAKRVYRACQVSAGRQSFQGFCGLMTSHQLYNMGINKYLETKDGNKQFDYYSTLEKTTGGYYIMPYAVEDYSLEEALNAITQNGTRDAFNIIVGFQWTTTEAGAIYGHACVINAILDGTVYFVESFYTSLGGNEGNVIQCSIPTFAAYFNDWMVYEGLIHFGDYPDTCKQYPTNAFVQTRFDTTLRSQPCVVGMNDCVRLRDVGAGEVLQATALVEDRQGRRYYRVDGGEYSGYVAASAVSVLEASGEDLYVADFSAPDKMEENHDPAIAGKVEAKYSTVQAVCATITDASGSIVLRERQECLGKSVSLDVVSWELPLDLLGPGIYELEISADAACTIDQMGQLKTLYPKMVLHRQLLQVGQPEDRNIPPEQPKETPDGWVRQDGTWYYYENGSPVTGWLESCGRRYYLKEDGTVTVGWAKVEETEYYFSATGAVCSGWFTADGGVYYLKETGGFVTGKQEMGGQIYFFADDGLLIRTGEVTNNDIVYTIAPDGRATVKQQKK